MTEETFAWICKQDGLRQGDIIRVNYEKNSVNSFQFGVIINADCDMQNNKLDGVIAFLPIYTFEEYLLEFWLPSFIQSQRKILFEKITSLAKQKNLVLVDIISWFSEVSIRNGNNKKDEENHGKGDKEVREIIEIIEKIVQEVGCQKERNILELKNNFYRLYLSTRNRDEKPIQIVYDILLGSLPKESGDNAGTKEKEANDKKEKEANDKKEKEANDKKEKEANDKKEKERKLVMDQFVSAKKGIGDGHLFLSEIRGEENIGFVIRMRRIYSLEQSYCFRSEADLNMTRKSDSGCAYRIARLSPLYKYKLAQLFAYQYSRIGLPDEIQKLNDLAIDDICNITMEIAK